MTDTVLRPIRRQRWYLRNFHRTNGSRSTDMPLGNALSYQELFGGDLYLSKEFR